MPLFDCLIRLSAIPTPAVASIKSQAIASNEIFINSSPLFKSKTSSKSSNGKKAPSSPSTKKTLIIKAGGALSSSRSTKNTPSSSVNRRRSWLPVFEKKLSEGIKKLSNRFRNLRSLSGQKSKVHSLVQNKGSSLNGKKSGKGSLNKRMRSATPTKVNTSASASSVTGSIGPKMLRSKSSNTAQSPTFSRSGNSRLYGADFYHGDSQTEFNSALPKLSWIGLKASQGNDYLDPSFKSRWNQVGQLQKQGEMPLRIAYEYLNPGNGASQANYFMNTVGVKGKLPAGTRLALDFEGAALSSPQTLKDAAQTIYKTTGEWPIVYASTSVLPTVKKYVPKAPIWEANYNETLRDSPFFQFTDKPYDRDVFNGTLAQLKSFAGY